MKKKLMKLMILVILLFISIGFDMYSKKEKEPIYIDVYKVIKSVQKGEEITSKHLKQVKLEKEFVTESMIVHLTEPITAGVDIESETYLCKALLFDQEEIVLKSNERLITVKCTFEESNGWQAKEGSKVDLVMIGMDDVTYIENVIVFKQMSAWDDDMTKSYYQLILKPQQVITYYDLLKHCDTYVLVK